MRRYTRTIYTLFTLATLLFAISYAMLLAAGINAYVALIWNVLASLDVGLNIIDPILAKQPLVLTANLIDAFVFALMTVVLAATFFDFIKELNLTKRFVISKTKKIKDHIIIVPYNNFALNVNKELRAAGHKTVIITENDAEAHKLYRQGELAIVADSTNIESFNIAGINNAMYVITCADDDIQNALITITAKTANPKAKIISRVNSLENISKLGSAGAMRMIMPEVTAGAAIGEEVSKRV